MNLRLTADQLSFLRSQPTSEPTKVPLALRIVDAQRRHLAEALGMKPQQLSNLLSGSDMRLSTAHRIAGVFGARVDDLFPAPESLSKRRGKAARSSAQPDSKRAAKSPRSKGPKAKLAEAA